MYLIRCLMTTEYTPDQLAQMDIAAGWPLPDVAQAVAVQLAESGGNPKAYNASSGATGLFQDLSSHNPAYGRSPSDTNAQYQQKLYDPTTNIKEALQLFNAGGWAPWQTDSAIRSGAYDSTGALAVVDTGHITQNNFATTPSSAGTNPGVPFSGSGVSAQQTGNLTGVGGLLQQFDTLLNPKGPGVGVVKSILSFGTADLASEIIGLVELLAVRGLFTLGFMGLTYLGIKMLTGGSGGSVVNIVETQQRLAANQASEAAKTERANINLQRSQAAANRTTTINRNTQVNRTSTIHHVKAPPRSKGGKFASHKPSQTIATTEELA